jgi:hypothetical protein
MIFTNTKRDNFEISILNNIRQQGCSFYIIYTVLIIHILLNHIDAFVL